MSRLYYVGAVLAVTSLLSAPLSAQNRPQNREPNQARVQHVVVRGNDDAMEVEIQTSGAIVAPDTQAITGPYRIVVDFPGALPAAELRALNVNRGALKGVRSGLFFSNPPITRIVLDLTGPQKYQISTIPNAIVVRLGAGKLGPATPGSAKLDSPRAGSGAAVAAKTPDLPVMHPAKLRTAALVGSTNAANTKVAATNVVVPKVSAAVSQPTAPPAAVDAAVPPKPFVSVTFINGMLRIRAEKATLSQVLFEVQRQTQAEIAIPAGAEQEQVIADLGPAPARDVLAALLNGSRYNFIFVGTELSLERVILTRRDSGNF